MIFYGGPQLSVRHKVATTPDDLAPMVRALRAAKTRGFDTETDGTRFASGKRPIGYSLGVLDAAGDPWAWYVPFGHATTERQADPRHAKQALTDALDGAPEIVGHNLKFDVLMSRAWGAPVPESADLHDTMIQAYLIREGRRLQLEHVANWEQCSPWGDALALKGEHDDWLRRRAKERRMPLKEDDKEGGNWAYLSTYGHSEVPVVLEAEYACRDVVHALVLDQRQRSRALSHGQPWEDRRRYLYWNEMMLIRALADCEWHGQPVDGDYLRTLADELDVELDIRGAGLDALFGEHVRWGNDNDLREFVYGTLGMPVKILTDKGQPSIERGALLAMHGADPRLAEIAEFRVRLKVRQTYTRSLAFEIDADGCVHTDFRATGTETGRLSAKRPNLQNMPIRHVAMSKAVRKAFLVRPGRARLFGDYSQVELRVLAWVTGSRLLIDGYRSASYDQFVQGRIDRETYERLRKLEPEVDVHANVAKAVFHAKESDSDWKLKRRAAKIINFGCAYGMGPGGLETNPELLLAPEEAEDLYKAYHGGNPDLRFTQKGLFAKMRLEKLPRFTNWAGRCRHAPGLVYNEEKARAAAERESFAALVQGSAAEFTRVALVQRYLAQRDGRAAGITTSTVHDELQVDVELSELPRAARETQRIMENFPGLLGAVPLIADLEMTTTTWAAKEKYHP